MKRLKYKVGDSFKLKKNHPHYYNTKATMSSFKDDIVKIIDVDETQERTFRRRIIKFPISHKLKMKIYEKFKFFPDIYLGHHVYPYRIFCWEEDKDYDGEGLWVSEQFLRKECEK